jgi:GAF domain-containing protein
MVSAEAFEAGKVIAIADIQQAERFAALELPNIKAMLVVPILSQGEWWGALETAHSHARDWDTESIDLLVELGNLLAIAIERSSGGR